MKTFDKPQNLNGAELKAELLAAGIEVNEINDSADGKIHFATDNEVLAASIVSAHNGTITPQEPTIESKLASVGLSLPDLKAALGL
jgi:hypothetical protein